MENKYEKQANQFLKKTNTEFKAVFLKAGKYFEDDEEERDIYEISLKRGEREFKFSFGQSINESGLKLFSNGKRTRHKNFLIPKEIRERLERINKTGYNQQEANPKEKAKATIKFKNWFEKEHFKLGGLQWELGKIPTPYDVLACLTKGEVGTFENFCADYGYDTDSRKAERIYKKVVEEYNNIKMLFNEEELEELRKIN